MADDLPTPEQILEELADKAANQIDRLAPVAFDSALDELIKYHRFMLAINATRTQEGQPFSFAEVAGTLWVAPHEEWLRQYRRLFERAVACLTEESDFLAKLARVPSRLLPREGEFEISPAVLQSIVDLIPILAFRLESWVTKRTIVEDSEKSAGSVHKLSLAGSDSKAYSDSVVDIVGAWESLLHDGRSIYDSESVDGAPDAARWKAYGDAWPFLWRHLTDTAYLLAIAAWNEDSIGTKYYRDALIRWPITLDSDFRDQYELLNRRLVFPDVMTLSWEHTIAHLRPMLPDYHPSTNPDELLRVILRGVHDDVVLLTAALLLHWTMAEKQVSDLGATTASLLLRSELLDPDDMAASGTRARSFRALFLDVIRLEMTGARFEKERYGARLDELVRRLDMMTERRVVTGRVFTPTTLGERESLLAALTVILLATVPRTGDDQLLVRIEELAADEEALPDGDRSLRNVLRELDRLSTLLEAPSAQLMRGLTSLAPEVTIRTAIDALLEIVRRASEIVGRHRTERLRQRPVDQNKLNALRAEIEKKVLAPPADILFFRNFSIEKVLDGVAHENFTVTMSGISKAEMVEPPMESLSSNFTEHFAGSVQGRVALRVWSLFCDRAREPVSIDQKLESQEFWNSVRGLARQVGADPVLVVSRQAEGRAIRRFLYPPQGATITFNIERNPPKEVRGNYLATIEGIEVFGADFPQGTAWLFSGKALKVVRYGKLDEAGHCVTLDFESGEDMKGKLRAKFAQEVEWTVAPIFEVTMEDPEEVYP